MLAHESPWLHPGDTLVCFGDSITHNAEGYVSMLAARLSGNTVINAGRTGDKTPSALTRLQTDVIARKPAAVSLFFGANDAAVGRACWADEPRVSPEAYRVNLVWIVHLCRLAGIQKFCILPPLWRFEGPVWAEQGDILAPYCAAAREAASELRVPVGPVDSAFADAWAARPGHTGLLLTHDGVHPTADGHRLIADTLLRSWGLADA